MKWGKLLNSRQSPRRMHRSKYQLRNKSLVRKNNRGFFRSSRINFENRFRYSNWKGYGSNITLGCLLFLCYLWLNPVLQEARNKNACINISTKVVSHFYPDGEPPLNANEFSLYSAYKDCTFGD